MNFLVTGGCGFIGSNFCSLLSKTKKFNIVNLDLLTYAGDLNNTKDFSSNDSYKFIQGDIGNTDLVRHILDDYDIDVIVNFAAESHVDRSIGDSKIFCSTNIAGTLNLLDEFRLHSNKRAKKDTLFFQVSTDEVYGDLNLDDDAFLETSEIKPSSPYSASKASSDHLVRAWFRTFKLPTIITNCSNNYGPHQFPEKFIPVIIINAIQGKSIPIYGNGKQVRDWLYVDDHARALLCVACDGKIGETYNIGGHNELKNIDVAQIVCNILDEMLPNQLNGITKYEELISYIDDRAGGDVRYAIDASKIFNELGWKPRESFNTGIKKTIKWYIENKEWYTNKNK